MNARSTGSSSRHSLPSGLRQVTGTPHRPALSARTILAILREQSVSELEARRRVNSDPVLRAELELTRR